MSDMERATVTSSSSQLETVQPFTIDESPGLELGIESPKVMMDSSTLMCTSIDRSPVVSNTVISSEHGRDRKQRIKMWTNSNQLSREKDGQHFVTVSAPNSSDLPVTIGEGGSRGGGCSDGSSEADDYATNQSARSTATALSSVTSRSSSSGSSSSDSTRTHSNSNKDAYLNDIESKSNEGAPSPVMEEGTAEEDTDAQQTTTAAEATTSARSSQSETDEGLSESVFANLEESAEGISVPEQEEPERPAPRSSQRGNKNEIANLIEKAILDFCSSRTVETMRRMFAGVTNDTETLQRDGGRHDDKSAATPHPVTGELVKEGVIIGDVDVFAPRMQREFILPVCDSLVETFLREPGVFRAICYRTRCQVEVTRRLLNRKLCIGGRWHKYMIIRIVGPTNKCITNCDILLQKAVPSYKWRKEYQVPATCRVYMREDVPDNAELYYGFQRTGGTSHRFGALRLESPYRSTQSRNVSSCPWKFGLFRVGKLSLSDSGMGMCMKHVYPSMGYNTTENLEREYQGVSAVDRIQALHEQFLVKRQAALSLKRNLTIPVCR